MNILAFSDTHTYHKALTNEILEIQKKCGVDTIVCCGDFSNNKQSFWDFISWLTTFNIKNKIIVGGNHDVYLSQNYITLEKTLLELDVNLLHNSHLIIDDVKFFGTPYFSMSYYNAHYLSNLQMEEIYNSIDKDTNVLLTHNPPYQILDSVLDGPYSCYTGDETLLDTTKSLENLKCHIFGHIHENYGYINANNKHYYNVAIANYKQNKLNNTTLIKI